MRSIPPILVLAVLLAASCKNSDPPAPRADPAPQVEPLDRRSQCERLTRDAARGAAIGLGLAMVALSEGSQPEEDAREAREALAGAHRELLEACLSWPEETLACLSKPLAAFDEDCRHRVAELTGQAVAPRDVPAGPGIAWRRTLPGKVRAVHVTPSGIVLVVLEGPREQGGTPDWQLLALEAGESKWSTPLKHGTRLALAGERLIRWHAAELTELNPASGETRWRSTLPAEADSGGAPWIRTVARASSGWLVADDEARFFVLPASGCPTGGSSCWTALGRLPGEILDEVELVVDDERIWLREYERLRALSRSDLEIRFEARAHDRLGWATTHPAGFALAIDDEVVVLDPDACSSTEPVALSRWPQPGRLHAPELDGCPTCPGPPDGCVKWRRYVRDLDASAAPAVLEDGTIVVHDDRGFTLGLRDGQDAWTTATAGMGPPLLVGTELLVLSTGFAEGDRLTLRGLAGDGRHRFESALPFAIEQLWVATDAFPFAAAADLAVIAHETEVVVLDLADGT